MIFGLSRPCGNGFEEYMNRNIDLGIFYTEKISSCSYRSPSGNLQHPLYFPTSFSQTEYGVYRDHRLLDAIKAVVPKYSDDNLRLNSYRMYYRTYSEWKFDCQAVYTTHDLQNFGEELGQLEGGYFPIQALGISLFAIALFETVLMCLPLCRPCRCFRCCSRSTYIFYPIYVGLLIGILITNKNQVGPLNRLDKSMIDYAIKNECSDEVLMTALRGL